MKKNEIKRELIKRYKFIYENAFFILVPFMCEKENINHQTLDIDSFIHLEPLPNELLLLIESFLLSDINMENSELYKFMDSMKMNGNYLNRYNRGLILLERKNNQYKCEKLNLNCLYLLEMLYDFISKQSGDIKNRNNKLLGIDEYIRISKYKNDRKIRINGRHENSKDINSFTNHKHSIIKLENFHKFLRNNKDIGLKSSLFIKYISDFDNHHKYNCSILTEEEKQKIYLEYHDELPCDLEIKCDLENADTYIQCEKNIIRLDNIKPCLQFFDINEEDIFVDLNSRCHRYYQVCPYCGFLVNIPDNLLSKGIKKRIEDRYKGNYIFFGKNCSYINSYIFDKSTKQGLRRVLKK
mgnify:FL=1